MVELKSDVTVLEYLTVDTEFVKLEFHEFVWDLAGLGAVTPRPALGRVSLVIVQVALGLVFGFAGYLDGGIAITGVLGADEYEVTGH